MGERKRKLNKKINILSLTKEHISNNIKQYFIVALLFCIGIILGVIIVNNMDIITKQASSQAIITTVNYLKTGYEIDYVGLLKTVVINHMLFVFLLWFMGCSVIGIPIVYLSLVYKGFSLGYTISLIIFALGAGKGILFTSITLLMQNLFVIPAILAIAVSGMNLYSAIIKDRKMENIKLQIIKHTFFCLLMLAVLIVASVVEVYFSNFLFKLCINYF